jgi:hypothetical protein
MRGIQNKLFTGWIEALDLVRRSHHQKNITSDRGICQPAVEMRPTGSTGQHSNSIPTTWAFPRLSTGSFTGTAAGVRIEAVPEASFWKI